VRAPKRSFYVILFRIPIKASDTSRNPSGGKFLKYLTTTPTATDHTAVRFRELIKIIVIFYDRLLSYTKNELVWHTMRVAASALYHTGGWGGLRGIHTLREHKVLHNIIYYDTQNPCAPYTTHSVTIL